MLEREWGGEVDYVQDGISKSVVVFNLPSKFIFKDFTK